MTISKDLFLTILAMDAYNQGYDPGVAHGITTIGGATVDTDSEEIFRDPDAEEGEMTRGQAASFYAIAYDIGADGPEGLANQTVISYRSTDSDIDWFEGWTIGAGMVGWNTSKLALDFYTAVTEQPSYRDEATDTIVTGHSPGRLAA